MSLRIIRMNSTRAVVLIASLSVTLLVSACGGGDSGGSIPPPTQTPTIVRVDVSAPSGTIGTQQTVQASATARLSDGS